MIVLVGKTCSGKSTVADLLESRYDIHRVRTYTTRPRREGEGTNEYHFISDEEFDKLRSENFFFETTHYNVANGIWKYGTGKEEFCKDCCVVMNPDGVKKVKNLFPPEYEIKIIYLNVTEGVQWNRLRSRGQDADESSRRIEADKIDFKSINYYYDLAITTDRLDEETVSDMIYNFIMNY